MTDPLSVNEALDHLSTLAGNDVQVRGVFHYRFEDVAIYHCPNAERRPDYGSSIWLTVGFGSLAFDRKVCEALDGKDVLVTGSIFEPHSIFGAGHMGLWPAELLARTLEQV